MYDEVREILRGTLKLGARADTLTPETALMGNLPELDSMAVVAIITALEENYGFTVSDDEISADTFETFGSLTRYVQAKLSA